MSVYSLLDQNTRRWWYHRQLRDNGEIQEARRRERRSIRDAIRSFRETIKNGGYLSVGRGGWTLHIDNGHTWSGYGEMDEPIVQAAMRIGIPTINTLTMSFDNALQTISLPMVGISRIDDPPYRSLSYAPLQYVAEEYRKLGATLYNFPN